MRTSLIVAAGGSGSRFRQSLVRDTALGKKTSKDFSRQSGLSKLFFPLAGRPLLAHSIDVFQKYPQIRETIFAVPPESKKILEDLIRCFKWRAVKVVNGGRTRAQSVRNGLRKADRKSDWIMVHDGARPFVAEDALRKLFREAPRADGVILAKKMVPTIKQTDAAGEVVKTIDRANLYEAQTPQLVRRAILEKAYQSPRALQATDEAALLESVNARVRVVAHEGWNPKITTAQDLELARAFLGEDSEIRTGFGRDTHRLVRGRKFFLGGVRLPFERGPLGHSDGDALLHAIADAILGATGAGDLGEWFSDQDKRYKNIRSEKMLKAILQSLGGWQIQHIDTIIILERPRLGPYKKRMRRKISELFHLPEDAVSVKAKTAEGLGPEGEGRAVSCEAIVTVRRIAASARKGMRR